MYVNNFTLESIYTHTPNQSKMSRQDHQYVNLPKSLMEVVDTCVTTIFQNGAQVYRNRKDFIEKSVQAQIEKEKIHNQNLARKLDNNNSKELVKVLEQSLTRRGGKRPKNA